MTIRGILIGSALAASLVSASSASAATIIGDIGTFIQNDGSQHPTVNSGYNTGDTVSSLTLIDWHMLSLTPGATVYSTGSGGKYNALADGYTGQVFGSSGQSETIGLDPTLSALGFEVDPDLNAAASDTITVTLSDGTSQTFNGTYGNGVTQFVGVYGLLGSGVTSMTISTSAAPDFGIANIVAAPEPLSVTMLASGLLGLGFARRRTRA